MERRRYRVLGQSLHRAFGAERYLRVRVRPSTLPHYAGRSEAGRYRWQALPVDRRISDPVRSRGAAGHGRRGVTVRALAATGDRWAVHGTSRTVALALRPL